MMERDLAAHWPVMLAPTSSFFLLGFVPNIFLSYLNRLEQQQNLKDEINKVEKAGGKGGRGLLEVIL